MIKEIFELEVKSWDSEDDKQRKLAMIREDEKQLSELKNRAIEDAESGKN
jgi:hypothetical protein